ncbi:MAG: hypothetical protein QM504_08215 [Pseudomonadota bacterium]
MEIILSKYITIIKIKEGIVLFNKFSGDTHFITVPNCNIIKTLAEQSYSLEELLAKYFMNIPKNNVDADVTLFNQFITDAIGSGIIVEDIAE